MCDSDNSGSIDGVQKQSENLPKTSARHGGHKSKYKRAGTKTNVRWLICVMAVALLSPGAVFAYRHWRTAQEGWYLNRCREARGAQKWPEMRALSQQWSAWDPSSVDAKLFEADADTHLQDFESAAACLSAIPDSHPKVLPSLVALSAMQFGPLSKPIDGVKTCERILGFDRRATTAHHQLIEFYAVTLQRRKLEQQIRYAIECSREPPKAYVYLFLVDTMRISGASESNVRWLEQYPETEAFQVARVLHLPEPENGVKKASRDDKYSLADELFKRFPTNLELLAYKVDVSLRSGDLQDVITLLSSLPAEADDDNRFWRAKGWLHLNRNELPKAKEALNEAIHLFPMDWHARSLLADALRKEGRLSEAEELHELVQTARQLRTRINAIGLETEIPTEILTDLAKLAQRCGDTQVSEALNRRLRLNVAGHGANSTIDSLNTAK